MRRIAHRFRYLPAAVALTLLGAGSAVADDTEIFVTHPEFLGVKPNVLFIIDTSGSMSDAVGSGPNAPSRMQVVRQVATELTQQLRQVNLGLMRYRPDAQGGYVLQPVMDIDVPANKQALLDTLDSLALTPNGRTPLSETYYEAALYFSGGKVDYGSLENGTSIPSSRREDDQTLYKSPINHRCQKNYIVYLTDGLPTSDTGANEERIPSLTGSSCPDETPEDGSCMDELAAWLSDPETDLAPDVEGNQNVMTYMIGFGEDVASGTAFLDAVAAAGGTQSSYSATDAASLTSTLASIFRELQTSRNTFVTPTISVNAFNRAQTSDELFFPVFRAANRLHWDGNLKKYRLKGDQIVDANEQPAVVNGFFADTARSIWSPTTDGADVTAGGAVSRLPDDPVSRKLFTSLAGGNLSAAGNALSTGNALLTDKVVGTGDDTAACSDACSAAIGWARGVDVDDQDPSAAFIKFMGDPLHGQPAVVTYDAEAEPRTVVYVPTNDGFLHAIAGETSTGGKELWAFMPKELLHRLGSLRQQSPALPRTYGLDGDVLALKLDKDRDGVVEANDGDRVWIFFGMRSGGRYYYGMDVTDPASPSLMWTLGPDQLPGVGETWSPPVITRVRVKDVPGEEGEEAEAGDANDDPEKFVLIVGGGYDPGQEEQPYSTDDMGNRIFMVDAMTGKLLWFAGGPSADAAAPMPDLLLDAEGREMNNAIPARVTVIDTNGDLFADRMYAGDMGGRIWRFDIFNGKTRSELVTGGVFAMLGNGGATEPTAANNRRFYNAPDVALIRRRGESPWYNIAIGSGYRGHPLDKVTVERFYSLRDPNPFDQFDQKTYDELTPIQDVDADLPDVSADPSKTAVAIEKRGWRFTLNRFGAGEKVLAEATTVNNVVLFTTFEPVDVGVSGPCNPTSINRAYALTAFAGKPALDFNDDGTLNNDDIATQLSQTGIVGAINFALLRQGDSPGEAPRPICLAGVEVLRKCVGVGGTVRTFWQRDDVP